MGTEEDVMDQSTRDALADAETFMRVLGICYPASEQAYSAAYHAAWAASRAIRFDTLDSATYARAAAHAAFRAVPGLRG